MDKLARLCAMIDQTNEFLGKFAAWSAFAHVITQFGIVLVNHLYSEGSIASQESLTYMHSLLFLGAAGYTLLHNGHVRVDILYSSLLRPSILRVLDYRSFNSMRFLTSTLLGIALPNRVVFTLFFF